MNTSNSLDEISQLSSDKLPIAASLDGTFNETLHSLSNLSLSSNEPAAASKQPQRHYWVHGLPWHSQYEQDPRAPPPPPPQLT